MLPNVSSDTLKMVSYGAEVAGRLKGIAVCPTLVGDAAAKAALEASAARIETEVRGLFALFVTRATTELLEHRVVVGQGRGVDRGFEAGVATVAETLRTSLPDRTTSSAEYRAVFPDGTTLPFTKPTIKQDPELCATLRSRVSDSASGAKAAMLAVIDGLTPIVTSAADAIGAGEGRINEQWNAELNGRRKLVDALWEEQRKVQQTLGRSGRGLARFVFFDFRDGSPSDTDETEVVTPPAPPIS